MLTLVLHSLEETQRLGGLVGSLCQKGDAILLTGTLGAGKTTLTRFIAWGFGVPPETYITSPSFSLMNEYSGRLPLYHIDCYRLEDEDDVEGSGLIDYIVADGLTVIEWPERLGSLKPDTRLEINLAPGRGEQERNVNLTAYGDKWQKRLQKLHESYPEAVVDNGI